jgi:hypothetical protein
MTDRDTFAAAALTGLLAGSEHTCDVDGADHAETAYHIADAMLLERDKEVRAKVLLTAEEREAIESAVMEADAHQHESRAATLRNLLERTI